MWIKSSGVLSENIHLINTPIASHYLVVGDKIALIDSGIDAVSNVLVAELEQLLGEGENLDYLLLTHCHFDHVGGASALKKRWPKLQIISGTLTAQNLSIPETYSKVISKNVDACRAFNREPSCGESDFISALKIERVLGDGDVLDLGADVSVKLVASPGHTQDSVSYYVSPDGAIICGEAMGSFQGRELVFPCFENLPQYLQSLERLSRLDVKVLGMPHGGAISGTMVAKFFHQARVSTENFSQQIKQRLEQGELIDEITSSILPEWQSQNVCPDGPFVAEQSASLKAMVKAVATGLTQN
jgi:glyoxylase-like metal-dependent hydrolase (beta-lactamase superfamily II)